MQVKRHLNARGFAGLITRGVRANFAPAHQDAKIEEMAYGEGGQAYFEKLKVKMDIFLKEGVDLEKPMPIPDQYKS